MREANVREHYRASVFNKSIYSSYRDGVLTTLKQTQRSTIVCIACLALKLKRRPRRLVSWCRRIRRLFISVVVFVVFFLVSFIAWSFRLF